MYRLIVLSKLPGAEKFKISCPAHLRFREKKRCKSAIPVIFPPIGQKSYVYKAGVFTFDSIRYFIVNQEKFRKSQRSPLSFLNC